MQFAPKLTKVSHISMGGSLWVEFPNPSKSVTKFTFQLGTRNSPCQIYRGEIAQNDSFIGVHINSHVVHEMRTKLPGIIRPAA